MACAWSGCGGRGSRQGVHVHTVRPCQHVHTCTHAQMHTRTHSLCLPFNTHLHNGQGAARLQLGAAAGTQRPVRRRRRRKAHLAAGGGGGWHRVSLGCQDGAKAERESSLNQSHTLRASFSPSLVPPSFFPCRFHQCLPRPHIRPTPYRPTPTHHSPSTPHPVPLNPCPPPTPLTSMSSSATPSVSRCSAAMAPPTASTTTASSSWGQRGGGAEEGRGRWREGRRRWRDTQEDGMDRRWEVRAMPRRRVWPQHISRHIPPSPARAQRPVAWPPRASSTPHAPQQRQPLAPYRLRPYLACPTHPRPTRLPTRPPTWRVSSKQSATASRSRELSALSSWLVRTSVPASEGPL